MIDLTPYFRELERIVGDQNPDNEIEFNFHWTNYEEGKRVIGEIRTMQKEIRLLKKHLTSEMTEVRSHLTTQRTAIGKGAGSALGGFIFGRKAVGSMNAARRDEARVAQHNTMSQFERMKRLMDQVLADLDGIKASVELSEEYSIRPTPIKNLPRPRPPIASKTLYWAYLSNEVKGPFSREQLSGLITAHVADDTTLVCIEGTEEWKGLYEISELAELLTQ